MIALLADVVPGMSGGGVAQLQQPVSDQPAAIAAIVEGGVPSRYGAPQAAGEARPIGSLLGYYAQHDAWVVETINGGQERSRPSSTEPYPAEAANRENQRQNRGDAL